MDLELSDEQRLIQETARDFVDNEIVPRARDNDRAARFDRELARRLGDMGYLGAPVAEEYGGRGLDYVSYGLIVEEVGRGDSSARTVVSVQTSLVCGSIERWGSEEQKRRWLPRLCSGEALGCFGLSEPDAGSDPSSMRTRARFEDGRWLINGQKMWISLGNHAELALIFAQTDPEKRHRGIACFCVPTSTEGYSSQEIHGKLGLRAFNFTASPFLKIADRVYYPDVMVACGKAAQIDLIVEAPVVVVEVTSPSTRATDRREKLEAYRRIPSLTLYLIVEQRRRYVLAENGGEGGERAHRGELAPARLEPLDDLPRFRRDRLPRRRRQRRAAGEQDQDDGATAKPSGAHPAAAAVT